MSTYNDCISPYNNSVKLHVPKPRRVIPVDILINNWNRYDDEVLTANWWESKPPLPIMAKDEIMRYLQSNVSIQIASMQSNNNESTVKNDQTKAPASYLLTPDQTCAQVSYSL